MAGDRAGERRDELVALLGKVAEGDRAALREVYDRTSAKLFGAVLRILGDREEAEDVLQEVYLIIWRRAGRFDAGRASPITWLATIARNRAIDRRRQIGGRRLDEGIDAAAGIADDAPDAFEALAASEDGRRLAACLGELDARAREAILAAFYGGRTYEDLAMAAAVPIGTMKSVIRRGLIRLRGCLRA